MSDHKEQKKIKAGFFFDQKTFDIDYEYMFGDDLLVAPVTEPDMKAWTVYLPGNDQVKFKLYISDPSSEHQVTLGQWFPT
jgi:hypothetical protein